MKVVLSDQVYRKVMYWVDRAKTDEVSGLGTVQIVNGEMHVTDAILLPQRNGAAHTDIEAEDVCRAMFEMRNAPGELKWWWHSHVQMGVFWSGTDHVAIKELGNGGWIIATVFNQKREKKSCFYSKDGMTTPCGESSLFLDDLMTEVAGQVDPQWEIDYIKNVENVPKKFEPMSDYSHGWEAGYPNHEYRGLDMTTPKALTKKERKALKRTKNIVKPSEVDDYGLIQSERQMLAENGYDLHDIDELVDFDFTPSEILQLAAFGYRSDDVIHMLEKQHYTQADVMKEMMDLGAMDDGGLHGLS